MSFEKEARELFRAIEKGRSRVLKDHNFSLCEQKRLRNELKKLQSGANYHGSARKGKSDGSSRKEKGIAKM